MKNPAIKLLCAIPFYISLHSIYGPGAPSFFVSFCYGFVSLALADTWAATWYRKVER